MRIIENKNPFYETIPEMTQINKQTYSGVEFTRLRQNIEHTFSNYESPYVEINKEIACRMVDDFNNSKLPVGFSLVPQLNYLVNNKLYKEFVHTTTKDALKYDYLIYVTYTIPDIGSYNQTHPFEKIIEEMVAYDFILFETDVIVGVELGIVCNQKELDRFLEKVRLMNIDFQAVVHFNIKKVKSDETKHLIYNFD